MRVNPGSLNKRISIYAFEDTNVDVEDGAGGFEDQWEEKTGWTKVCNAWANIRPTAERTLTITDQVEVVITHTVLVRYNPLIKAKHVISYQGRRLDIRTIRNFDEDNTYLQLMCEEEV